MSDAIVEQVAGSFSGVTFLDVSSCKNIGARALKSFGAHCKSLVGLRRTMHPLEVAGKVCQDDEALAIALAMPKLRHLELAYLLLTTQGVLQILAHCHELRFLDIRGCWEVKLEEKVVKEKYAALRILGPEIVDSYERSFWDECSDYSDASEYSWGFMEDGDGGYEDMSNEGSVWDDDDDIDGENVERLQVRFYGGGFNEAFAGFEWPLSP